MGDREPSIPDEEQHVIVAAHHVVKALVATKNLSIDLRKMLADLDSKLTKLVNHKGNEAGETSGVEDRFNSARETVLRWQSNRAMIWDSAPQEASEYLQAVDEIRRVTESLGTLISDRSGKDRELLNQAHTILDIAMGRLERELIYILSLNVQSFESESVSSFRSCEETSAYADSPVSTEDYSVEEACQRVSNGTESDDFSKDLIHSDVVSDVKCIANLMFASNYGQEFCSAFVSFWKDTLDEYLTNLGVEKVSTEEVMKMDRRNLSSKIKKWCRAIKMVIRPFLTGQKRLFDQVLGDFGLATSTCFLEASKGSILCLLSFGQAIAIGPREPDRVPNLINMYEALANVIPDIDALFEENDSFLRFEFSELLSILGDTIKTTFLAFGDLVAFNPSPTPFPNGGVHHLTKYVMNYLKLLAEYGDTLNLLLDNNSEPLDHQSVDSDLWQNNPAHTVSPTARQLCKVTSMLERNLDNKSHLYKDVCLKHIFMMNNIHYMVQKVKYSDLRTIFGDQWIRIHNAKFQKHATIYQRATWCSIICLLKVDGITSKSILKERCKNFSIAFEEVYKNQTGWSVPDIQVREDLRNFTLQTVINAYRLFVTRVSSYICDRHIKYSDSDVENYILDLFGGSPRSLPRRR